MRCVRSNTGRVAAHPFRIGDSLRSISPTPFLDRFRLADHTPEIAMPMLANASMWALNAMAIRVRQSCEGPYLFCVVPTTRRVIFVAWMVWSTFSSLPTSPPYNVCVNPEGVISLNTSLKVNFFRLIS